MFRLCNRASLLYCVGLSLGAIILALFIGARLINYFDPYRTATEKLIQQVAEEPPRTARLDEYGTIAVQIRQSLPIENAATWADWLDRRNVPTLIDWIPFRTNVKLVANRVDTAVHKIAAIDDDLETIEVAVPLSQDLARLRFYDLDRGDVALADLYHQSTAVSHSLSDMSEGLKDMVTAVAAVTTFPMVETIQQELLDVRNMSTSIAASDDGQLSWIIPQGAATDFAQLADLVNFSIESWQGMPATLGATQEQIAKDVTWLDSFEQEYRIAKAANDRWHYDTLRRLPRFVADFHQLLLLGFIGSLILAIVSWIFALLVRLGRTPAVIKLKPYLVFCWPNGTQEYQTLSQADELTIGNIVIRRARVCYYLELIDNAFPAYLNGNSICGARTLNDGDVLQIDELQTTFQLAA